MRNNVNDFVYPVGKEAVKWILVGFDLGGLHYNTTYKTKACAELAMKEGMELYPCLAWNIFAINERGEFVD